MTERRTGWCFLLFLESCDWNILTCKSISNVNNVGVRRILVIFWTLLFCTPCGLQAVCSVALAFAFHEVTTCIVPCWPDSSLFGKKNVSHLLCLHLLLLSVRNITWMSLLLPFLSDSQYLCYLLILHQSAGKSNQHFFYFSEKRWINEYISIPKSACFAYKGIKHMLTTVVPSSQKFVLTYVVLVINFLAAILMNCVTLLRWLCLLKVAELCWQFDWGLVHYACS